MSAKNRVLTAFRLEGQEDVPVTIYGGGAWTIYNSGNTFVSLADDPEKMAEVIINTYRKMGWDMVFVGSGYNNYLAAALGGEIKAREGAVPDLKEHFINSAEDLEEIDLASIEKDPVIQTIWEATRIVAREIGSETVVTATAWGPFTFAAQLRGVENLMRDVYKKPDLARGVIEISREAITKFYSPLVEDGTIEVVALAEPTASGDLISKRHFEEFVLPPLQRFSSDMKNMGAYTFLHICGNTTDKLDAISKTGVGLISIDSKVDIAAAKSVFSGVMCLGGNVNPVSVIKDGTPAQVEEVGLSCLQKAAPGGGFFLMPGCDIPPSVPEENIKTLIDTARKFRTS
jgi:uroporphyrinogen decarboxylase